MIKLAGVFAAQRKVVRQRSRKIGEESVDAGFDEIFELGIRVEPVIPQKKLALVAAHPGMHFQVQTEKKDKRLSFDEFEKINIQKYSNFEASLRV